MIKYKRMKKLIAIISLAAITNIALAFNAGVDVGFKSKLLEQGVLTGNNQIVAGANVEVGSFGLGVNSFSTFETSAGLGGKQLSSSGIFKRVDLTADYKFKSDLADIKFGAVYKNASKSVALGGIQDNILPFAKVGGKVFTIFPWDVTALFDRKNHNSNYEANIRLPIGTKHVKIVPALGVGFNNVEAATVAALQSVEKYYQGGVGIAYNVLGGTVSADVFVQSSGLSSDSKRITGYSVGYSIKL